MAQRKRRRKKKQEEYPGWMWMLFGLALGLSVAFAVYKKDMLAGTRQTVAQDPASLVGSLSPEPATETSAAAATTTVPEEVPESRFTFYKDLPKFEVVIPEEEPDVSRDVVVEAIAEPGSYVLQAGSFTELMDADRRRAQLALQGIESHIQRIAIDERTFHRVRIGPINNLDELNQIRSRLRQAKIDVLRIRLDEQE